MKSTAEPDSADIWRVLVELETTGLSPLEIRLSPIWTTFTAELGIDGLPPIGGGRVLIDGRELEPNLACVK